ncbi:MAG: multi-sensor signal transduction histidine kinase [Cyanobacteria bacterium RYN_339]|nr:multi-sensor signal transduction histidine kinase [Cyanobacteria bacterium RYN_339]
MGLRLRIMLICLLLAGLSTVVVVAGVVLPKLGQYPKLDQQLAETSRQSVRLAGLTLANELDEARQRLTRLADHEYLAYRNHAKASQLFKEQLAHDQDRPALVALDDHLQAVASATPLGARDFSALPIARQAQATDGVVRSGLVAWPDGGQPRVVEARRYKFYDRAGEHWGVLLEALDLARLDRLLNHGTGTVEVFDATGRPLIPVPASATVAPATRPEVAMALGGRQDVSVRADHSVMAYAPVPGFDWAVLASTPTAQMLLPLERDIRQATLSGALAMLIGAVLAVLLSAFLVAPIRRLEAGAAALARGEWEAGGAGTSLLPTHRDDELGRLAKNFELMAAQLRDRFRGIEEEVAQRTSDLKDANLRLTQAVEELKALDELKRAFLDAVSHELRTPLNFIMGYGSTLADGLLGPLSLDQERAVEAILGGSDRLLGVINDLIEISRLEAGLIPLVPVAVDLGELIAIALEQLDAQVRERELIVTVDASPELSPAHADPERVGQILKQLLTNAIKFTEPGGHITVSVRPVGDRLVTEVADTGMGIPAAALPYIWESFRQGDGSLTRRHGGTGVGLAIVKRLLDAMGERVEVESEVGVGSRFRFTLPVASADGSRAGEGTAAQGFGQQIQ